MNNKNADKLEHPDFGSYPYQKISTCRGFIEKSLNFTFLDLILTETLLVVDNMSYG